MRNVLLLAALLAAAPSMAVTMEREIAQRSLGGGDRLVVKAVRHDDLGKVVNLAFTDGRTLADEVSLLLHPQQARDLVAAFKLGDADREGLRGKQQALRTVTIGDTEIQLIAERRYVSVLLQQENENVMVWLRERHIQRIEDDVEAAIAVL